MDAVECGVRKMCRSRSRRLWCVKAVECGGGGVWRLSVWRMRISESLKCEDIETKPWKRNLYENILTRFET